MKMLIWIGITVGGIVGGWIGSKFDGGASMLGMWSILLSGVGSIVGIFAAYKIGKSGGY